MKTLLQLRKYFWLSLNTKEINIENFVIYWNWILKYLNLASEDRNNDFISENLKNIINKVDIWLKDKKFGTKTNILWKYGGYPQNFHEVILYQLYEQILLILKEMENQNLFIYDWKLKEIILKKLTTIKILNINFNNKNFNYHQELEEIKEFPNVNEIK